MIMMRYALLVVSITVMLSGQAFPATYYVDNLISCTGTYNPSTRDCTGSSGNSYTTVAAGVAPLVAGDTLYIRAYSGGAGVWDSNIDLINPNKSGSAGLPLTIAGYPGDVVTFRYTSTTTTYPMFKAWNRDWLILENIIFDGSAMPYNITGLYLRGNNDCIVRNVEVKNNGGTSMGLRGSRNLIQNSIFHDNYSTLDAAGHRFYGLYYESGDDNIIERNTFYHNTGGGIQIYNGSTILSLKRTIIRYNRIYENNKLSSSQVGGITVLGHSTTPIESLQIYGNIIYRQGKGQATSGGGSDGIGIIGQAVGTFIHNNTIYDNQRNGIHISGTGTITASVINNIVYSNDTTDYTDSGASTLADYNAAISAVSIGTNKITITDIDDCIVSKSLDDFRLKQGTNPCRNSGSEVAGRPSFVNTTDVGAYEQPEVGTMAVVGSYIEVRIDVMTPGLLPTSGITGFSVTCLGCSGTPVIDSINVKASSNLVIQIALSGITSSGTCQVAIGSTNVTDSLFIGGPASVAQGLNSLSATTVTGTCANSSGVSSPGSPWSHFALNEGSGTVASDDTGNNRHGTVSTGVTWVADASGTGLTIPTDASYKQITSTFGSGVNPASTSFAMCAYVKPSLTGNPQKVILSSGTNGVSQRWYAGWVTVGAQVQWGIGIQGSGFSTGSEFPVTEKLTLVCIVSDSGSDTAILWVDGVKGTTSGKSVKTFTSYALTNNLIVGNDGTNTVNNGGFTVYEVWIWDTKPTDLNMTDLWGSLAPASTNPCLAQTHVQWEFLYTDLALSPIVLTPKSDGSIDVIANGGIAFRVQYTCTVTAGVIISPRLYYSTNGVDFNLPVPQTLGSDNVAMWGPVGSDPYFNSGASIGCIDGTGLTTHSGVTIIDTSSAPSFSLAQNHCRTDRFIVRFGNVPGSAYYFRVKSFSGVSFANGYAQDIKVNVVQPQASPLW